MGDASTGLIGTNGNGIVLPSSAVAGGEIANYENSSVDELDGAVAELFLAKTSPDQAIETSALREAELKIQETKLQLLRQNIKFFLRSFLGFIFGVQGDIKTKDILPKINEVREALWAEAQQRYASALSGDFGFLNGASEPA